MAGRASAMAGSVAVMASVAAMSAGVGGCRGVGSSRFVVVPAEGEETLRADGRVVEGGGVRLEYSPGIDRVVYAGPVGGPNLLEVRALGEMPDAAGGYTFYGGLYSWVAPQGGEHGWVGPEAGLLMWPPDPAMDVGPARVVAAGDGFVESVTPADAQGLVQRKRFAVAEGGAGGAEVEVRYTLVNEGDDVEVAGPWLNTAVRAGSVMAVKLPNHPYTKVTGAGAVWEGGVRAWNEDPVERFWSIAEGPFAGGWTLLYLDRVSWDGGTKFFIDGASEIAVWSPGRGGGAWLHRRLAEGLDEPARERLIGLGEAPVAVYVDAGSGVIEAELYGRIGELGPGEHSEMVERWRVVPSREPSVLRLEEGAGLVAR